MKKLLSLLLVALICVSLICVMAEEPKKAFSDVDASTAIGQAIEVLASAGILSGDGDGKFRPNDGLSRAELCKIVNMIFKYTEKDTTGFSDVPAEAWYHDQVLIAKKAGYIKGYEDGTFRANNKVTREQACVILARVTGLKDNGIAVEIKDEVAEWALPSVKLVVAHKLMALEEGNTFRATQNITRGEFSHTHAGFVKGGSAGNVGNVVGGSTGGGSVVGGNNGIVNTTPSATPTATPSVTPTATPSASPTATPSATPTATPSASPTATPSATPTATPSASPTATPSASPTATPKPNYEVENAEMVRKLDALTKALDDCKYEFSDEQWKNIISPLQWCIKDAIIKAESNIITNIYIRKTYETTITGLSGYIDTPAFDKGDFQERMGIVDEVLTIEYGEPGALVWLFQQFGIWEKVQQEMS